MKLGDLIHGGIARIVMADKEFLLRRDDSVKKFVPLNCSGYLDFEFANDMECTPIPIESSILIEGVDRPHSVAKFYILPKS